MQCVSARMVHIDAMGTRSFLESMSTPDGSLTYSESVVVFVCETSGRLRLQQRLHDRSVLESVLQLVR